MPADGTCPEVGLFAGRFDAFHRYPGRSGVVAWMRAVVGCAASFGIAHYILHTDWIFLPRALIYTLAGALAFMLLFGYAGTAAALRVLRAGR